MKPWILEGEDSALRGPLRIAWKDMRFYNQMAQAAPTSAIIASAVSQVYGLANLLGHSDTFMPALPGILAELVAVDHAEHLRNPAAFGFLW